MKKLILILVLGFTFLSCTRHNCLEPQKITPILIGKGDLMGSENIPPQMVVFRDSTSWNGVLNSIDEFRLAEFSETTTVNFNSYQIIAVFSEVFGNGGHSIDITNVIETENNITVTVIRRWPTGNLPTVMSQPFHIIKIPISPKPVVFN